MNQQMLGAIHQVLTKLGIGFNAAHRVIALTLSNAGLNDQLYLQLVSGQTAINDGLRLELICLSTNDTISLQQCIGQTATVAQQDEQGQRHVINGIITQAARGQSDGGFSVYKLTLQDSFSGLLPKRRNSRVFMQQSVIEITQTLFAEWQQKSALLAKSLALDLGKLTKSYDVLPFTMQSQESDYDFLTRLWRRSGINWLIDSQDSQQTLNLFDDSKRLAQNPVPSVYFHHADSKFQRDSIHTITAHRQLQASQAHVQRWSLQHGSIDEQASINHAQQSETNSSASLNLEQAYYMGDEALGDLKGQDKNTPPSSDQLVRLSELFIQRRALDTKSYHAIGSVRQVKLGHWFSLLGHPQLDQKPANQREFLITQLAIYAQNNLPKHLSEQVTTLVKQSQWEYEALLQQQPHQINLTLIQRDVPIVPFYDPLLHAAKASPMRARVVGSNSENIHVDAWGRIKVRFLFTRADDHAHSGGAGSSDTDTDSAWVHVLTPWAGDNNDSNYGVRFLPRVGELVVIDFLDGNADQPMIVGRIHEGSRLPAQFDHQGSLPETRALSGIKSQEIQGQGFNQLRFDDTTGQISAQLQSSHAASQLNLGNLSHPKTRETSDSRGEGFELRTYQFGALRAGQGLLVSTHAQDKAKANHLDAIETKSQLESTLNSIGALSNMAKKQNADPLDVLEDLQSFIAQLQHQSPEQAATFKSAIMLLSCPQSVGVSSQANVHVCADVHISQSAGDSINMSTQDHLIAHAQQKISLFAAQKGISATAAKGKVALHAQNDGIETIARKVIQIISTEDRIEITSPKEISLKAGGSELKLNGSGVFSTTGGKFEVKAGQHVFSGGRKLDVLRAFLPDSRASSEHRNFQAMDVDKNEPLQNIPYSILNKRTGLKVYGFTDENGMTNTISSPECDELEVKWFEHEGINSGK